jgi:hypothetical protein
VAGTGRTRVRRADGPARSHRPLAIGAGAVAWLAVGVLAASPACASAATGASATIAFSGSGTAMTVSTTVKYTASYTGIYTVSYNIYRSTSSARTSPVKVTANSLVRSISSTKAKAFAFGPNVQKCAAGTTTYYYWVQATISDGTVAGLVNVTSPVTAGVKGCAGI